MELTAAQRRIVEHEGGPLRISGGPGCGRTTALIARYLHLVEAGHRPSSVLVVCADRAASDRFRDAVLPRLSGGFDALPLTTWFGVAFDLVTREHGPVRLLSTTEQRAVVRRLLAEESPTDWPVFGRFLGRPAFAEEVASALVDFGPGACAELDRFALRYLASLADRGQVDSTGLLGAAADLAAARPAGYSHVLVDDHDGSSPALQRLLHAVAGPAAGSTVVSADDSWPAVEVALTEGFRRPAAPTLVCAGTPPPSPKRWPVSCWPPGTEGWRGRGWRSWSVAPIARADRSPGPSAAMASR